MSGTRNSTGAEAGSNQVDELEKGNAGFYWECQENPTVDLGKNILKSEEQEMNVVGCS